MDIKHLRIFVLVAEGQSMATVAESFGVTKSAISHSISSIEKELKVELFLRDNKMRLTEHGEELLRVAKKTLSVFDKGLEQLYSITDDVVGDLRIGVGSFIEPYMRKAVERLLEEHPSLNVDAHIYRASTLNQMLRAGKLDVAFTLNKAYDDEGIVSEPCIPIHIGALMNKRHKLAGKDKVTFEELCKYDCIMPSEDRRSFASVRKYVDFDLSKLRNRVTINTADGALNMVEEGNYLTFGTPQIIVNRPNLVFKPIVGMEREVVSNMHYLKDVHLKRSAVLLRDILKDFAIPLMKMITI